MLPSAHIQEALSRAYVYAVSSRAGCIRADVPPDYGVDFTLRYLDLVDGRPRDLGATVDLQLKASTDAARSRSHIVYDLDAKNHRDLVVKTRIPRVLVLFVMPPSSQDWLSTNEARLTLKGCAYWKYLRGEPPSLNRSKVRVEIPRKQRFDVEAVRGPLTGTRPQREVVVNHLTEGLDQLSPSVVQRHLESRGWHLVRNLSDEDVAVYDSARKSDDGRPLRLFVPLSRELPDYLRAMNDLVCGIASLEESAPEAVLRDVLGIPPLPARGRTGR